MTPLIEILDDAPENTVETPKSEAVPLKGHKNV